MNAYVNSLIWELVNEMVLINKEYGIELNSKEKLKKFRTIKNQVDSLELTVEGIKLQINELRKR